MFDSYFYHFLVLFSYLQFFFSLLPPPPQKKFPQIINNIFFINNILSVFGIFYCYSYKLLLIVINKNHPRYYIISEAFFNFNFLHFTFFIFYSLLAIFYKFPLCSLLPSYSLLCILYLLLFPLCSLLSIF